MSKLPADNGFFGELTSQDVKQIYPAGALPVKTTLINHSFTDHEFGLSDFNYPILTADHYPHYTLLEGLDLDPKIPVDYDSTFSTSHFSAPDIVESRPLSLKRFFLLQQVDTPIVLHQPRSKFRPSFEEPTTSLVNMLSSHGFQPRIRLWFLSISRSLITEFFNPMPDFSFGGGAHPLLTFLSYNPLPASKVINPAEDDSTASRPFDGWDGSTFFNWRFGHNVDNWDVDIVPVRDFDDLLFSRLRKYIPIFAMKSKRVDKMRFKHSRGKSGKYTVEWKYVPRYKRLNIVLRWLVDDLRFQKAPTFKLQMLRSLRLFLASPDEHLVGRNRAYVHRNVYVKYKNTLLRSLKKIH